VSRAALSQPQPLPRKLKRVAYLVESALTPRNRDRFGLDWMACQGIEIIAFDVGPMTLPDTPGDRSGYGTLKTMRAETVADRNGLQRMVSTLREADLVVSLVATAHFAPRNIAIYRAMAQAGTPYLLLSLNAYPGWTGEEGGGVADRLRRIGQRLAAFDPAKSLTARLPRAWLGVPAARFVVYGGRKSRVSNRFVDERTIAIAAHSMDYDAFRAIQASASVTEMAVFVDEYRPYHPDLKEMGLGYTAEQAAYYFNRMRALFDRIERELGLKVVIAAMPKADYSDKPGVYGDRVIEYGKTAELVAASRLVLAHRSTAIGYAVMSSKPVLQIATREIYLEQVQKPYFDAFAAALGKPIQFCDDVATADLSIAFAMDDSRYRAYLRDYVTENPEGGPLWQIIRDQVEANLGAPA
jgi:hypothetical protein